MPTDVEQLLKYTNMMFIIISIPNPSLLKVDRLKLSKIKNENKALKWVLLFFRNIFNLLKELRNSIVWIIYARSSFCSILTSLKNQFFICVLLFCCSVLNSMPSSQNFHNSCVNIVYLCTKSSMILFSQEAFSQNFLFQFYHNYF